jgi:hypothetical protein
MQGYDWRYLKAKQIYLLFSSFIETLYPNINSERKLKKVEIFKSKFGKEQMEIEEREGPSRVLEKATMTNEEGEEVLD